MSGSAALSYRDRFRYTRKLRKPMRSKGKWSTVAVPTAPVIEAGAMGGGIVKILLKAGYLFNDSATPVVEWSVDGITAWTAVALTGYVVSDSLLTTAAVAVGAKYFRVRGVNTFGSGANSNLSLITVT